MKNFQLLFCILFAICHNKPWSHAYKLSEDEDLDRAHKAAEGVTRLKSCKPSQVRNGTRCILAPTPPPSVRGVSCKVLKHNFFIDTVETLALSQTIYEAVALRKMAKEKDPELFSSLEASFEDPLPYEALHAAVDGNMELLEDSAPETAESLEFMEEYNQDEGMRCIAEETKGGGREVVKFGDSKDDVKGSCVHMITVSHEKKRVDIVFRGSSNMNDWRTNLNAVWRRAVPNAVSQLEKEIPYVHLHRGFAKSLLGPHNSTYPRPIDVIMSEIKALMNVDYRLHVTGHSLGGALATIFGFYAAQDAEITRGGPVSLFTFASPRAGGASFRNTFNFLEERGLIRHARFRNQKDKVPMLPYLLGMYKHVGMEFRLRKDQIPVVDYPTGRTWTQTGQGLIENVISLPKMLDNHRTKTMLSRIRDHESAFNGTSLQGEYQAMWGLQ